MKKCIVALVILATFTSCSKLAIKPNEESSTRNNFNQFWNDLNDKYVFFDEKNVDWQAVKIKYESKLDGIQNDQQLFDLFSNVIAELKDGHTSLYTPLDTFRYLFFKGVPANFNKVFVDNNYLIKNSVKKQGNLEYCTFIAENIGYIYYNSFSKEIQQKELDIILKELANTKGLIIDIRDNTGGSSSNIYRLIEHFVSAKTLVGFNQTKLNSNKNAFTEPYKIYVDPKGENYLKPIVILTNRKVYSAAHIFTGFMSQLTNVEVIGDTTGGGTGVPTSNQLPNGWLYRFSSSFITLANGTQFENGVTPKKNIATGSVEESLGRDEIIETAIKEIKLK